MSADNFFDDLDHDQLDNAAESEIGTDPQHPDTDRDSYSDSFEVQMGFSPTDSASAPEGKTIPRQKSNGRLVSTPNDPDGDGLASSFETASNLNPQNADTDGDGIDDGIELLNELDPLSPQDVIAQDSDADGLFDKLEESLGTNPLKEDTDSDMLSDPYEILLGLDPLNPDTSADGVLDGWIKVQGSTTLFKFE